MKKILFFFFLILNYSFAQRLHHQMISSQGTNVKLGNRLIVLQSVGQCSNIGNYRNSKLVIGQGFIQSFAVSKNPVPYSNSVSVIVYPNPVLDVANFQFSSSIGTIANLYLFDSRGRLVYSKEVTLAQNNFMIDLSMVSEGVYLTKIETPNYIFSTKIIKSK